MRKSLSYLPKSSVLKCLVKGGSHVVLVKYVNGRKVGTVVPLHKELKAGTLMGVLRLAQTSKEDFIKALEDP